MATSDVFRCFGKHEVAGNKPTYGNMYGNKPQKQVRNVALHGPRLAGDEIDWLMSLFQTWWFFYTKYISYLVVNKEIKPLVGAAVITPHYVLSSFLTFFQVCIFIKFLGHNPPRSFCLPGWVILLAGLLPPMAAQFFLFFLESQRIKRITRLVHQQHRISPIGAMVFNEKCGPLA
jgi:hypothetical protein